MNYIVSENQFEYLLKEAKEPPFPLIVRLFKVLDEEKQKKKKRVEILQVIEKLSPYMGIPEEYSIYLLESYVLNYRKDGDYSGLTKENFVDPRNMKGKTTTNPKAYLYATAQMPFKGSNLEGYWATDYKGTPYYKVVSYGWYPVYIFKDNKWYEVTGRFSSSTGRQMNNANPVEWDNNLGEEVYLLSQDEMKMLERGVSHEEVLKHKLEMLKKQEPELTKRKKTAKTYRWWGDEQEGDGMYPNANIKYKIKSVDVEGDKAIVTVDIHDVVYRGDSGEEPTPQNYLKGEMKGMDEKRAEGRVKEKLRGILKDYMKTRFRYTSEDPPNTNIEFKFNHLKK